MNISKVKTVSIVCGGPHLWLPELSEIKGNIIGVDKGAWALVNRKIPFRVAIGDFDSVTYQQKKAIEDKVDTFMPLPAQKDVTDCEAAVMYAVSQGYKKIVLYGVTGGRFDHQYAIIALMLKYVKQGIWIQAKDEKNKFKVMAPGMLRISRGRRKYLSFFALEKKVVGLTLKGVKYPLKNYKLLAEDNLCVSNEFKDDKCAEIFLRKGYLLVIQSSD